MTRQVEPKLVVSSLTDFPVLSPSGQGEIGCMPALPSPALRAQAETEADNFVAASSTSLKFSTDVPLVFSPLPMTKQDMKDVMTEVVGIGGYKNQSVVGHGGYKQQIVVGTQNYKDDGDRDFVGVGGVRCA